MFEWIGTHLGVAWIVTLLISVVAFYFASDIIMWLSFFLFFIVNFALVCINIKKLMSID